MEWSEEQQLFDRLDALFGHLVNGEFDQFEAGCHEEFFMNVRGSAQLATQLRRSEIAEWYRSMQDLAEGSLRSSVCLIFIEEGVSVVVLQNELQRDGERFVYQTENRCLLRAGRLAACFSYPMISPDYARAWGIRAASEPQPV
jgi:hypothetical protein